MKTGLYNVECIPIFAVSLMHLFVNNLATVVKSEDENSILRISTTGINKDFQRKKGKSFENIWKIVDPGFGSKNIQSVLPGNTSTWQLASLIVSLRTQQILITCSDNL